MCDLGAQCLAWDKKCDGHVDCVGKAIHVTRFINFTRRDLFRFRLSVRMDGGEYAYVIPSDMTVSAI